jgi:diaminopimelate decarboxylase
MLDCHHEWELDQEILGQRSRPDTLPRRVAGGAAGGCRAAGRLRAEGPAVGAGPLEEYPVADEAGRTGQRPRVTIAAINAINAVGITVTAAHTGTCAHTAEGRASEQLAGHAMTAPASAPFHYVGGELLCESASLTDIARRWGTPTYVYSRSAILGAYQRYVAALAGRKAMVCYAMKANSNLGVLDLLARAGSGFDIVSGGELARALAVGADPTRIVFSGVGKNEADIGAALLAGIACFNVESAPELDTLDRVARGLGRRAPVSFRINPDVDPRTHPYISTGLKSNKFGVSASQAEGLYREAVGRSGISVVGIDCHIGSQITTIAPYIEAAERVLDLVDRLAAAGIPVRHIDFGGGLGIRYRDEAAPAVEAFIAALLACVDRRGHGDKTLIFEPGRSIVGNAGVLLTRVEVIKPGSEKNFAIIDAAMNDLLRPALYDAWMDLWPVRPRAGGATLYDVVGPVCESADWLARERELNIAPADLLAILSAGAYGMSMASNYNSRGRAAEVIVDGDRVHLVRARESSADLYAKESRLPV